jgi:imidazole glycerol phosphate synthase glutamine amidotransferase subunit
MGWNQLEPLRQTRLLEGVGDKPYLYFAHSYYCPVVPATAAICNYIVPYTAVLEIDNVQGVQFHPEKSGNLGLKIVQNFVSDVGRLVNQVDNLRPIANRPAE